jgi:sugar O-acyltransferase (sialic acid O-acetyltransferase NeuD family)
MHPSLTPHPAKDRYPDVARSVDHARFPQPPLILIGGGGHAQVVLSAALAACVHVAGFVDDNDQPPLATKRGLARLGPLRDFTPSPAHACILALGDLASRRVLLSRFGEALTRTAVTLVHPTATIDPSATLGKGVYVGPHAVIHACARVRDHAIINTASVIEHDCDIGENAHIAPGTVLAGKVTIGEDTMLGIGSRVIPGIIIGPRCTVGAGAVVVRNVPAGVTVKGIPAK